ncbi:DNA/RNA non-specific endonuclease [Salinibacterium hongtaonis]|uniref:DNA/RNA non-specific endonuclease n=1 Tax=Homoserinimonas hongtaonis TaxID=2079791 RepID=UPI000D3C328E|nr:DNA/RNA non-specific endonuclease [Salinibacterium hongtaonis]AWB89031.1 hypothetical protein C2138_05280 [Salinibacterium hongtaonis]
MTAQSAQQSAQDAPADSGYSPDFLQAPVPLPRAGSDRDIIELDYTHFTVLLDRPRRLAAATAVNIDGAFLVDVERGDYWHLDERIPATDQAGPELYRGNDLDRGHLVRRRDPVWGEPDVAARANFDTFVYTNAAPQVAGFNQSQVLWSGLEDYVLEHARVWDLHLTVFTGPIFTAADPLYRGIQIPLAFWKVAAWVSEGDTLASTGYVLDQSAALREIELTQARPEAEDLRPVPPLGAFGTFQVPITDIEELTRLNLGPLARADRLPAAPPSVEGRSRWVPLRSHSDIVV